MNLKTQIVSFDVQNTKDLILVTVVLEVKLAMAGTILPILRPKVILRYPRSILSEVLTRDNSMIRVHSAETGISQT